MAKIKDRAPVRSEEPPEGMEWVFFKSYVNKYWEENCSSNGRCFPHGGNKKEARPSSCDLPE